MIAHGAMLELTPEDAWRRVGGVNGWNRFIALYDGAVTLVYANGGRLQGYVAGQWPGASEELSPDRKAALKERIMTAIAEEPAP